MQSRRFSTPNINSLVAQRKTPAEAAVELGISDYLQMDNESCFSGGYKHPGVIGQAVRSALYVGTQPLFLPFYHPKSNSHGERFHQDYSDNVWKKVQLGNLVSHPQGGQDAHL